MKSTPDLVFLPGREKAELWRFDAKGGVSKPEAGKRNPDWVGLPMRGLISLPVRLNSTDRAQQDGAIQLELEAAGLGEDEVETHRFDVFPGDPTGRDSVAAVFVSDGVGPAGPEPKQIIDSQFAPAVYFRTLVPGVVSLWEESGRWIMAVPHASGRPIHVQGLTSLELDGDAAAELRCIFASLELQDLLPALKAVTVEQAKSEKSPLSSFGEGLDLDVGLVEPVSPSWEGQASRLTPDEVVDARHQRRQTRVMLTTVFSLVLVVAAALTAFGARLYMREQAVVAEEARLDAQEGDLALIRDAQQHWDALHEAVTPDQYAVELFFQLVSILPPEGIRVTRFDLRQDTLIIEGEASSVNHAISFRGDLTGNEFFKEWGFDRAFFPSELPDRRASFRTEGKLNQPAPEGEEGGGLVGGL